ncbi:MAG: PSD1 domain-containing protein [Candidatus Hydrogenedentes bacterium]|nr:PSD1 domain-containing protein [Candidatus Hydrogenedentota bacterium]
MAFPVIVSAEDQSFDFFEQHVRPVLIEHCYSCHSVEAEILKGELSLDSRDGTLKGGKSGKPAIVPGAPDQSLLIEAIRYHDPDLQMPPKKKLDEAAIEAITAWIAMGAPDPRTQQSSPATPTPKKLWALEPVGDPAVPAVQHVDWVKTPVDAFVLQKLEEAKLTPAQAADKRTLLRRATYDLTGLPPTPEEVDAFIADESPNSFEKVVDRLLASPHYGERWGRHWLDVARYADTKGYVYGDREEARFVHSYVYRDWVVRALNDDMPYDQFLLYQIAGDQLATDAGNQNLAAMGFLTLGRRFLGVMHDIIDDRIDTLMRGTQALTVACARCHDHKFDPIPTEDYYSLYGIFSNSSERTVELASHPEQNDAYKAYKEQHDARVADYQKKLTEKADELSTRLRAQVKEYLVAVLDADKLPTEDFYEIRQANEMNPTIVRKWQAYLLKRPKDDPIFEPWLSYVSMPQEGFADAAATYTAERFPKEEKKDEKKADESTAPAPAPVNARIAEAFREKPPASMKEVAERYGDVFLSIRESWRDALEQASAKGEAMLTALPNADNEALRQVLFAADSPVTVPRGAIVDLEWYFDEPTRVELGRMQRLIDESIIVQPGSTPHAVILEDRAEQRNARVFKRGNPANRGDEVPRQYLAALSGPDRHPFGTGSGRLELARAIANDKNPLTARVMVNRIWLGHFGQGLVRTPSDFGSRSELPSHAELLDYLATYFMREGWSMKRMHRLIMLSNTYQQISDVSQDNPGHMTDPENRLLWHFNRQRLDFEGMRDFILAASGKLDLNIGGRGEDFVKNPDNARRTLYGYVDRQFLPAVFRVFDFPNPDMHSPQRFDTTVPQQSLFMMNGRFLMEQARGLASSTESLGDDAETRIRTMYRRLFQREPTADELAKGVTFLASVPPVPPAPTTPPTVNAWKYGYGMFDAATQRMASFEPLPHFTGNAWQGGTGYPDGKLGWLKLTAETGHPGNDMDHTVIRRWVSPISGTVNVSGKIKHETPLGNGIGAKIISSKHGVLGEWKLHNSEVIIDLKEIAVEPDDTVDFVVDIAGELNSDDFRWSPIVTRSSPAPAEAGANYVTEWNAAKDFAGETEVLPEPLPAWGQYAQVLLLSNEFAFID